MQWERDLLLSEHPSLRAEGFGAVERGHDSSWIWALGTQQSLEFLVPEKTALVSFTLSVPEGCALSIFESSRLLKKVAGQNQSGAFSVASSDGKVCLRFVLEGKPPQIQGDDRALSFLVNKFYLTRDWENDPVIQSEVERVVSSGAVPDNICVFPFLQLYVNEGGCARLCCHSDATKHSSAEEVMSSGKDFEKAWNSAFQKKIRKQMLLGEKPIECRHCYDREAVNGRSLRQYENTPQRMQSLRRAFLRVKGDGSIAQPPMILDFRLGNKCNLRCRMCFPSNSVNLINEFDEYTGISHGHLRALNWFESPEMMEAMIEHCAHTEELVVAGGEPFLIPKFRELLAALVSRGLSQKITLRLTTNFTQVREDVVKQFVHFRAVHITVSIDGIDRVNDYIRYPSKFARIDKNLRDVYGRMEELGITGIGFNTSVQIYNIFDLPQIYNYLSQFEERFDWITNADVVRFPVELSIQVLPSDTKEKVRLSLDAFVQREKVRLAATRPECFQRIQVAVQEILNFMFAVDHSSLLPEFQKRTKFFDAKRESPQGWWWEELPR